MARPEVRQPPGGVSPATAASSVAPIATARLSASSPTINLAGQMTSATDGVTTVAYRYDGDGNRASSTRNGITSGLVWDSSFALPQLALERDSTGALARRYSYGQNRITMTTPAMNGYYSNGALGTVTEISDAAGASLGEFDSNPFGDNASSSGLSPSVSENPFGFSGEYQDPTTGLYDLRARQYDPSTGRFLAPDPLGPQNQQTGYAYVADNPLRFVDPSGLKRATSCSCSVASAAP